MTATAYANDTQTAIITVERIIPAPSAGRSATIKDAEGLSYGIWPNRLAQVQIGLTYHISFSSTIKNGVVFRDIKDIRFHDVPAERVAARMQQNNTAQSARPAAPAAAPGAERGEKAPGGSYYRPTSPRDAERMFVCSMMNALITSGRIETDGRGMVDSVNVLRKVWQHTFGQDDLTS